MFRYTAAAEVLRGNIDAACAITAAAAAAAATAPLAAADANAALRSCILSAQARDSSSSKAYAECNTVQSHALRSKLSVGGAGEPASSQLQLAAIETAQEAARLCPYDLQAWLALCKA